MPKDPAPIVWQGGISNSSSYLNDNSFRFLNITQSFGENIDWNFDGLGKLWTYNLNYFDFLNQHQIDQDKARKLVEDYIEKDNSLKDGHEPYPISLRGINWIKFLAKNRISSSSINQKLYQHYLRLKDNLEYHLLGNHLLENGYSMLFGAYYFENENFYGIAHKILKKELNEQILEDGAHFELSPMYHQILLHRLLDCINLIKNNPWKKDDLLAFLFGKAKNMAGWLKAITYKNGNVPMVNDCAYDIAPTSDQLLDYAKELEIRFDETILGESGYRMIQVKDYEMFIDVGNIGPDYQPGHAHSDTFSFELLLKKKPFIVDVGTSTYEKNEIRHRERQTSSHNTVMVEDKDQSQVWDGFRVARRARIAYLKEGSDTITSAHDGYKSIGVLHERSFNMANSIIIRDKILCKRGHKIASKAYFHFHPSIKRIEIDKKQVVFEGTKALIDFEGEINDIKLQEYEYCAGFNKTEPAQKVCVSFARELKTTILL
nr:alginate lyase family protein [Allomuricauda sp.]